MSLTKRSRLGPYEIVAPLGAGGMGEVYRARDTRLGRMVALKVLPGDFSSDPKLRIRFEREAKAISALNHPHICALHDVGESDQVSYLVMEHCEGKTLAERLTRGPLPMHQAIEFGIDIADALDKAHRVGIIHRDLKPSNIMITKSGVKLLDFGLAKQRAASSADQSTVTEEGTIVGTIQYMAPELLQGKEADARSDIFALGLLLYEMATGKPAFSGTSKATLIAAILEHEPPMLTGDSALDRLVRACLEKDPNERVQNVHDVVLQLRWIADSTSSPARRRTLRIHLIASLIAAVIILAIGGLFAWRTLFHRSLQSARFHLQPPAGVVLESPQYLGVPTLAISPDGEWVAFQGRNRLNGESGVYLRSTRELEARLIPGSQAARDPFFSPDSKWLAFFSDGALKKVAVDGGVPTRICAVRTIRGGSWGTDGTILFSDSQRLLRVSADGGEPWPVTNPNPERHVWPQFLPGGAYALVTVTRGLSDRWRKIGVLSLSDGAVHEIVAGTYARSAGDRLIYNYAGTLYSLSFDFKRLRATGPPKPVLDDVASYRGSGSAAFDLSKDGCLVYIPGAERPRDAEIVWVDRQGQVTRAIDERKAFTGARLSPDGKTIAAPVQETVEDSDLWTFNLERGGFTRLTTGLQPSGSVEWTPDGKSIVLTSIAAGPGKLVRVAADGSGTPQQLTFGPNNSDAAPAVSPDGTTAIFMRTTMPTYGLAALSLTSDRAPQTFLSSDALLAYPAFSPDGRWVAYESDETGQREVHVRPFPAGEPRVTVSIGGGQSPFWSHDGRELLYLKEKEVWSVPVSSNDGFHAGAPRKLFRAEWLVSNMWFVHLQASPDGKRFLTIRHPRETDPERRIVYAPSWIAELKQRR